MDNTNNNADVFCANCGAKMPAGTKFCISCGKPVGGPAAPNPNMTQQTAYATEAAPMTKTKIGITVGLFAAAIYFAAIFGGYVPVLLLGGYALIAEKDAWLKRVSIKAVAILMMFSFVVTVIGLIPDALAWIASFAYLFEGIFSYDKVSQVIDLITNLIDIFRTCLFLVLGVNALKMRDVSIGFIDNMINRNL